MMNLIDKDIQYTILAIDDNPTNLMVVNRILTTKNFKVISAQSAKKAMEILQKVLPDLILLDIMMPEIDGLTFAKQLGEDPVFQDIPIIFLTAKDSYSDIVQGFNNGAVDYITKPANNDELFMRVNNQLKLKHSKDIIKKQNRELEDLLNDKNEILEIAAHDLKSPLSGIMGLSGLVNNSPNDFNLETLIEFNESIFLSAQKMHSIISDVLEANSSETVAIINDEVDFIKLCNQSIEQFNFVSESKNIKILIEHKQNEILINSDYLKITRILDNLISNSIKFSPFNKSVFIKTDQIVIEGIDYAKFEIKDEGPGFTENDKSLLFKKFAKLSAEPTNSENSTKLGLAIVKKLIGILNGKIELFSKQNEGATFTIFIPVNKNSI